MRIKTSTLIIILIGILIALSFQFISAIDAPHNESNTMNCGNCHGQTLLNSPFWTNSEEYDTICTSCHKAESGPYSPTNAPIAWLPLVPPHADRQCRDCHNPHYQRQKIYKNTDADNLYLAKGKILSCEFTCPVCPEVVGTTTLTYESITYKPDPAWDALKLTDKTEKGGSDKRSATLFPNMGKLGYNYPITAVDTPDSNTITVKGNAAASLCTSQTYECDNPLCCAPCCAESCPDYPDCDTCPPPNIYSCSLSSPTNYAAIYGQYIRDKIDVSTDKSGIYSIVKFFDKKGQGSFADGDITYNGVCEVCHTQKDAPHLVETQCTNCHTHSE